MPQYQAPTSPVLTPSDREATQTGLPSLDLPSEWQPPDITQPGEPLPSVATTEPEIPVPKAPPGAKAKR
jgi:hypothetical protein